MHRKIQELLNVNMTNLSLNDDEDTAAKKSAEGRARRGQQETRPEKAKKKSAARPAAEAVRTWRDSTGKFSIRGKFVSNVDGKVTIEASDGSEVTIPLKRLSTADQAYLESIGADDSDPPE